MLFRSKADSLGSLEALIHLLKKSGIKVRQVGIGDVNKHDAMSASVNLRENPLDAAVVGFNVNISGDLMEEGNVKLIANDVIYKLIEDLEAWRADKGKELLREKMESLTFPCKIEVLRYVFRQAKPAIFGVRVVGGKLRSGLSLMNHKGKALDRVKAIQNQNKSVQEAKKGDEVAISLPSINYHRQLIEGESLYSDLSEFEFKKLKQQKSLLSQEEVSVLQEIADIKRKREKPTWGL